jgi:hypothetical protein
MATIIAKTQKGLLVEMTTDETRIISGLDEPKNGDTFNLREVYNAAKSLTDKHAELESAVAVAEQKLAALKLDVKKEVVP